VQAVVDAIADVFVSDVARYRGVSTDAVEADFGQGGVFVGRAGVDAGLVDGVGSFEQALAGVADAAQRSGAGCRTRSGGQPWACARSSTPGSMDSTPRPAPIRRQRS
jgi:ClpP class serine protease